MVVLVMMVEVMVMVVVVMVIVVMLEVIVGHGAAVSASTFSSHATEEGRGRRVGMLNSLFHCFMMVLKLMGKIIIFFSCKQGGIDNIYECK